MESSASSRAVFAPKNWKLVVVPKLQNLIFREQKKDI